jgi:NAD(P)-dependent dehydrogenase (short-subunit alcohol dehydrogenase family)
MSDIQSMAGKVAIITGAGGDVGAAACRQFLGAGASVLAVDRNADALARLLQTVEGDRLEVHVADVSLESDVAAYVKHAADRFGGIDYLFNNAGIEGRGTGLWAPVPEVELAEFEEVIAVNARGVFLGLKHAVPLIAERRGAVVNTASIWGLRSSRGQIAYVASKHAVSAMTVVAAKEWAQAGVRINAIAPGAIEGRMFRELLAAIEARPVPAPQGKPARHNPPPIERCANPAEIAELVVFLCSEDAAYLTGSTYSVDGGLVAS